MSDLINPVTSGEFRQRIQAAGGATTQAILGSLVQAATATGAVTVLLPLAGPLPQGTCVAVEDADGNASTNPVTINGNGTPIDGAATLVLSTNGAIAALVLDGAQWTRVSVERSFSSSDKTFERWSEAAAVPFDPTMGGDVTGLASAATVVAIQGIAVNPAAPVAGQVLTATGPGAAAWATPAPSGGGSAILWWGDGAITATTTTRYLTPGYGDSGLARTTPIQWRAPRAGTLRNLRVRQNIPNGNGLSVVYTIRVNNVPTALSVSMASTAADGGPSPGPVAVAAGDLLDVQITKALSVGMGPDDVLAAVEFA
jgi:hypothetical protein